MNFFPATALAILVVCLPLSAQETERSPRNSTRKIRTTPTELAARAGSGVAWMSDLAEAVETAGAEKLVLAYVPTVAKSFVDREAELDRKLLSGPFSWPSLLALLADRYVCVRLDDPGAATLGLSRDNFLPPGFLVLENGVEVGRYDRLTTHHPAWYHARLGDAAVTRITRLAEPDEAEALFLAGVDVGPVERAGPWGKLMRDYPEHPLAWKAAMELEGHGPLLRGQECYDELPQEALVFEGAGTRAALGVYDEPALWRAGARLLRRIQMPDGALRDSIYDFGGTDSLPNVYAAVTALASITLREASERGADSAQSADKARAFAERVALAPNADLDERVWVQIYALRAALHAGTATQPLADALGGGQLAGGAWRHEYANPFVTADALIALWHAREAGLEVSEEAVERGIEALLACRAEDGGYSYGQTRVGRKPRASIEASVGRAPKGELALSLWAPDSARSLEATIAASFEHEAPLLAVQKLDDHGPQLAYGGFFFWYDLHARTEAIVALEPGPARSAFATRQRAQIVALAEIDGCFVDSHELGRGYGTAMALWCLALLDSAAASTEDADH